MADQTMIFSRFYLKIYLTIIITMIASGLLMDSIWKQNSHNIDMSDQQFFVVTSAALSKQYQHSAHQFELHTQQYLANLSSIGQGQWQLKKKSAVQLPPQQITALENGQVVNLFDDQNQLQRLINIQQSPYYLSWMAQNQYDIFHLQNILLVLFYALMALGLFLALRPMMRETQYFQAEVRQFGEKNWSKRITLQPSSPFFDISASFNQMAERIQQLIQTQQELTHAIAHELRTPLARMKFALELVELDSPADSSSELTKQYGNIQGDIDELESLVNEMLDYATFDSSAYKLHIEQRDLTEFATNLVEKLQLGIRVPIALFTPGAYILEYDWHLLERALQNLIINAAKYANAQIKVSISIHNNTASTSGPASMVQIDIEDDGCGIEPENRHKVFDSFVQIKNQTSEQAQGFGLGLSITKRIIELHRGTICVTDSDLGGAMFSVQMPAVLPTALPAVFPE
jgi:two-component system, OmpR family, sensor kinase